jgi:hypothetical protein
MCRLPTPRLAKQAAWQLILSPCLNQSEKGSSKRMEKNFVKKSFIIFAVHQILLVQIKAGTTDFCSCKVFRPPVGLNQPLSSGYRVLTSETNWAGRKDDQSPPSSAVVITT